MISGFLRYVRRRRLVLRGAAGAAYRRVRFRFLAIFVPAFLAGVVRLRVLVLRRWRVFRAPCRGLMSNISRMITP